MEDLEIDDNYHICIGELNDGEVIYIQGEIENEITQEIIMLREKAIELALLILEITGYEERRKEGLES
jgi:hypothetical protein